MCQLNIVCIMSKWWEKYWEKKKIALTHCLGFLVWRQARPTKLHCNINNKTCYRVSMSSGVKACTCRFRILRQFKLFHTCKTLLNYREHVIHITCSIYIQTIINSGPVLCGLNSEALLYFVPRLMWNVQYTSHGPSTECIT